MKVKLLVFIGLQLFISATIAGDGLYLSFQNDMAVDFFNTQQTSPSKGKTQAIIYAGDEEDALGFYCMHEADLSNIDVTFAGVSPASKSYYGENRQSGSCHWKTHTLGRFGLVFNDSAGQHAMALFSYPEPQEFAFITGKDGAEWFGDYAIDPFIHNPTGKKDTYTIDLTSTGNSIKVSSPVTIASPSHPLPANSYSEQIGYLDSDQKQAIYKIAITSGSYTQVLVTASNAQANISMIFKPYYIEGRKGASDTWHKVGYVLPESSGTTTNTNTLSAGNSIFYYAPDSMGGYTQLRITQSLFDSTATSSAIIDLTTLPKIQLLPNCITDGSIENIGGQSVTLPPVNNTIDQAEINLQINYNGCTLSAQQQEAIKNSVYFTTDIPGVDNSTTPISDNTYLITNLYPSYKDHYNKDLYIAATDQIGSYEITATTLSDTYNSSNTVSKKYYISSGMFGISSAAIQAHSGFTQISDDESITLQKNPEENAQLKWLSSQSRTTVNFSNGTIYSPKSGEAISYRYYHTNDPADNKNLDCIDSNDNEQCDTVLPYTVVTNHYLALWWSGKDSDATLTDDAATSKINVSNSQITLPDMGGFSGHDSFIAMTIVSTHGEPYSINKGDIGQ